MHIGSPLWASSTRGAENNALAGLLREVGLERHIPNQGGVPDDGSAVLTSHSCPACVLRWALGTRDGDPILTSKKVTVLSLV